MHIGLFDLEWEGHNTPYARLTCRYLLSEGHEVTFYTSPSHAHLDSLPEHNQMNIELLKKPNVLSALPLDGPWLKILEIFQLQKAFRDAATTRVDIFHILCLDYSTLPVWIASSRLADFPIVASLHRDHFLPDCAQEERLVDRINRWGLYRSLKNGSLSRVFVHADSIAERLRESVTVATVENVRFVPCPTPSPPSKVSKAQALKRLNLPMSRPMLLFFGETRRDKGPDILLDAARELDCPVNVVYAGPEGDFTSDNLISPPGNDTPVVINRLGYIPDDELYLYFQAADALVLPYRRKKGISGPLRRACMVDTHLIASDDSDIGELVKRNELGQTFQRGSSGALARTITEYLQNRETYPTTNVRPFGRARLWHQSGKAFEESYHEVTK